MIKSITMFNPVFKQKYVNYDGSVVNVSNEAIEQAKKQIHIRKTVEDAIKTSDDKSVKSGDVYFTIFSDGSCKLFKDRIVPIYKGKADDVDVSRKGWISGEINAQGISWNYKESSDEGGSVRANGNGDKFAIIYPDSTIYMKPVASKIFPPEE